VPSLVTRNVRVSVQAYYAPARSNPRRGLWFFEYKVRIQNDGASTIQILTRHWRITDAHGGIEEVKGRGVVGQQPVLAAGEAFEYTSGCPLKTPFGSMEGSYQASVEAGEVVDIQIPPFALRDPRNMQ